MSEPRKFELTDERHPYSSRLRRIRALVDIPRAGVQAGDLGGWVESEANLAHSGSAWVSDAARIFGYALVSGDARVSGAARIFGYALVSGDARVSGAALVSGDARVSGAALVSGDARISGAAWVSGDARVYGAAWVYGAAHVSGDGQVSGDARVSGAALVSGAAHVSGDGRVSGAAWVSGPHDFLTAGPISSQGHHGTLTRTRDSHRITIGCWTGTTAELRQLAASDDWPSECNRATRERIAPRLLAFAALCEAQVELWQHYPRSEVSE